MLAALTYFWFMLKLCIICGSKIEKQPELVQKANVIVSIHSF